MTSVRLPSEIEQRLQLVSQSRHISKSEIIKVALERFFEADVDEKDSYELGKDLFGRRGSGNSFPRDYKQEVKEKIRAKHGSR